MDGDFPQVKKGRGRIAIETKGKNRMGEEGGRIRLLKSVLYKKKWKMPAYHEGISGLEHEESTT